MKSFIHTYRRSIVGVGLIAALGSGAYAMAQPAPPPPNGPSARLVEDREALRQEHMARREAMREHFEDGREARFEGRIAYLRTRLEITDEQQPLWENFVETLRGNMQERADARPEPRGRDEPRPNLLERLEREQTRISARADHLNATSETLVPLYNSFSDEQKQVADRVLSRFGENRMAMRDGDGGRGGPRRGMRHGPRGDRGFGGRDFDEPAFEGPGASGEPQQL
jgi:hypothetical protein